MILGRNVPGGIEVGVQRLRDYGRVRVPGGLPPVGSDAARAPLLERHAVTVAGQPWLPGMSPKAVYLRVGELGRAAAAKLHDQARREPNSTRARQLGELATRLEHVTPHQLRHGLADRLRQHGTDPAILRQALRQSLRRTTSTHGTPTDDDVRRALEESAHGA